jgi:hypothetical protein
MNKDITSSGLSSMVFLHHFYSISRRSSVCSWPCLFNRTTKLTAKCMVVFFFCLASLGLMETIILSGGTSFLFLYCHGFPSFRRFSQYPSPHDYLIRFGPSSLIISLIHLCLVSVFYYSRFVLLGASSMFVVIKRACYGIAAARRSCLISI